MTRTAQKDQNAVSTLIAVSSVDGVSIVDVWADPVTHRLLAQIAGGSSSGFQRPLTGALNQGTFTWTTAPNVIVVDGVPRQKLQTDGTQNWTGTTTTVLSIWPTFDIFSV